MPTLLAHVLCLKRFFCFFFSPIMKLSSWLKYSSICYLSNLVIIAGASQPPDITDGGAPFGCSWHARNKPPSKFNCTTIKQPNHEQWRMGWLDINGWIEKYVKWSNLSLVFLWDWNTRPANTFELKKVVHNWRLLLIMLLISHKNVILCGMTTHRRRVEMRL